MYLGDHHELHHHRFRLKFTELNEIYIFNSLRSLAFTFIAHFIPIYLLLNKGDIRIVFMYYAIMYSVEAVLHYPTAHIIRKIGPKHTIALSVPFLLSHFFFLQTLNIYNWPIWLMAISGSVALSLFWHAYHYDFSKAKRKKNSTGDVTKSYILVYILAIVAPYLGGFLMDNGGPFLTFGVAIILLLMGTSVLFKTSDKHIEGKELDIKSLDWKAIPRDIVSYAGFSVEALITMTAWPIFIYLIVGDYESVGLVMSATILVSIFIMYFVGKKSDKNINEKKKYIRFGALGKGALDFSKIFIVSIFGVYFVNITKTIFGCMFRTPWISEYYLHADEQPREEYILVMEASVNAVKSLVAILLIILSFFLELNTLLLVALVIGAIGAFLSSLMPMAKSEVKFCKEDFRLMPRPHKRESNV